MSVENQSLSIGVNIALNQISDFLAKADWIDEIQLAFGQNFNQEILTNLLGSLTQGNLPKIATINPTIINGANGTFDSADQIIYISQSYLDNYSTEPDKIAQVLLEEIGHYIDSQINLQDSLGDEGEIFSLLVQGKSLSDWQLNSLRSQNDQTTVTINGQTKTVELAGTYGNINVDGNLADWTANDRLDFLPGTSQAGYEIYGKYNANNYLFAIKSDIDIGAGTTIWLNTDQNRNTGYQIFGFAGGAEYNITLNNDAAGNLKAYLYAGGDNQTPLAEMDYTISADKKSLEVAVPITQLTNAPTAIDVLADVNNQVFLPGDYNNTKYTVSQNGFTPQNQYGNITLDGNVNDWVQSERLDFLQNTQQAGYQVYGKATTDAYLFAIKTDTPAIIGQNTTIWLNTDQNRNTGYQIFGFAGGAEYNINIAADGQAYLYNGAAGENFVSKLDYSRSADGKTIEVAVKKNIIGNPSAIDVLADVNNQVFLPGDYNINKFTVSQNGFIPQTQYGNITIDGNINDWTTKDRLDYLPTTQQAGFQLYGKSSSDAYLFAIKSDTVTIGQNSTIWLNTDQNRSTGYQIFGFAGGAEYNINIASDGKAYLYNGAAGQNFVSQLDYTRSADGKTIELAVKKNLIGNPNAIDILADVNDTTFLPGDYNTTKFTVDNTVLPERTNLSKKVGIIYSETSANQYFDKKAYSHLFTNAQNQAMQAGVNFDRLTEADLTDINKIKDYDALVFPSFRAVNKTQAEAIEKTLNDAVYKYNIDLIAAGEFMTVDETGQALAGNPYQRMQNLFDVKRSGGGGIVQATVKIKDNTNPILQGYTANEQIIDYTTSGLSFAYFEGASKPATVLAEQVVNGVNYNGILVTQTGGQNIHFASESIFADSNLAWQGIQSGIYGNQPKVGLNMTRNSSLFISRDDVDYSRQNYVSPVVQNKLANLLTQWKDNYNFVGSHYINIGNDPANGESTDWNVMGPIYQRFLSLGNEIGTHSYTHPMFTSQLTPQQLEFEFNQSKIEIGQKLGIQVTGAAIPGNPENLYVDQELSKYFEYLTGVGSAYTNSFGFLSPDTNMVFFAPNLSFDFNLIGFRKLTAQQAEAEWNKEFTQITKHGNTPILEFPWHDYAVTEFEAGYTQSIFTNFIKKAYDSGTEFATLDDVQKRIRTFDSAELTINQVSNTINAKVTANDVGKFGLDINGGNIKNVTNWYAYDNDTVFVAKNGGDYQINLGTTQDNVTRITQLPMRAELLSVSGDGQNLSYSFNGEGKVVLNLAIPQGKYVVATGADNIKLTGNILEMNFAKNSNHIANISFSNTKPADVAPTVFNPLPNLNFTEDNYVTKINLAKVFNDFDNDPNLIVKSVVGNSNLSLISTTINGNDLLLNYTPDRFGSANITIRGTSNGKTVEQTFTVNVNQASGTYNQITGNTKNNNLNGTGNDDFIRGLDGADTLNGNNGEDRLFGGNGNDIVNGEIGDDILVGGNGSDQLNGGDGGDILIGVYQGVNLAGRNQIDRLTGGAGFDKFILGDATQTYYNDGNTTNAGNADYALITDFNSLEDVIQLSGLRSSYVMTNSPSGLPTGKAIYHTGFGVNELIGIVQGDITNLTLNSEQIVFA